MAEGCMDGTFERASEEDSSADVRTDRIQSCQTEETVSWNQDCINESQISGNEASRNHSNDQKNEPESVSSEKHLLSQMENLEKEQENSSHVTEERSSLQPNVDSPPDQTDDVPVEVAEDPLALPKNEVLKEVPSNKMIDAYDVISKHEMQHLEEWESVQKSCLSEIPPIDPGAVHDLERRANDVAGNLDHMLGVLASTLKTMSETGVRSVDAYSATVDHMGEAVDSSVKSMYTLIAKCEQLDASMTQLYRMAAQIKDIKKSLDEFEYLCK